MNQPFFGSMTFRAGDLLAQGVLYMPHLYNMFPYAPSESWRIVNELNQEIGCAFGLAVTDDHAPSQWWCWDNETALLLADLDWFEKQTGTPRPLPR